MQKPDRIIIADDHPLFRAALHQTLDGLIPQCEIIEAHSLHDLTLQGSQLEDADLLLLDLNMPGAHGFSGLVYVCGHFPSLPVVVISANEDPEIMRRAINHGAVGFISKSSSLDELSRALEIVMNGGVYLPEAAADSAVNLPAEEDLAARIASLTPHQYRVFSLVREGKLNKQIAYELGVSEATVKAHVTPILRKLGVSNRTQAVVLGDQLAIATPEVMAERDACLVK